ncbi:unnamed protein product [Oncorhynchus mykiss]|uniref:START domain-containing protein n=1 Tax=Oncorhynchus mykiss TaxID=8022 RepID=A0A060VZJ7_ONCMY|nr:unnamed protein product [Oncorhynchus mykiss]
MLITKIEAKEACDWLKAAGFPQYVQLYKDCRFPIDIDWVKSDHSFLDKDALDSLCRRLNTLNKCVELRLELGRSKRRLEESEDEEPCAISAKWAYERQTRRWRRLEGMGLLCLPDSHDMSLCESNDRHEVCSLHSTSSTESEGRKTATDDQETSRSSSRCSSTNKTMSLDTSFSGPPSPGGEMLGFSSAEERFPDKPPRKKGPSLLRKMEKLRLRSTTTLRSPGHSGHSRTRLVISGPVLQVGLDVEHRLRRLQCLDISTLQDRDRDRPGSQASSSPSSPHSGRSSRSTSESSSTVSTPSPITRVRSNCKRTGGVQEQHQEGLHSGPVRELQDYKDERNNHESLVFQIPQGHKPGTFPAALTHNNVLLPIDNTSVNWRTGSFHGYRGRRSRGSAAARDQDSPCCSPPASLDHRASIYDNVPTGQEISENNDVFSALDSVMERISGLQQLVNTWTDKLSDDSDSDSNRGSTPSPCPSSSNHIHLEIKEAEELGPVAVEGEGDEDRESLEKESVDGDGTEVHQHHRSSEQSLPSVTASSPGVEAQPVSHLHLLRKLSLLKLTALMDKYSPFSKQGWNWFVGLLSRTRFFSSAHKCSIGLRSGLCDGHSNTLTLLSLSHFATTLEVCLASLSIWKTHLRPSFNFLTDVLRLQSLSPCAVANRRLIFLWRFWSSGFFLAEQPFRLCRYRTRFTVDIDTFVPVSSSIFTRSFAVVLRLICTFRTKVCSCLGDRTSLLPERYGGCMVPWIFNICNTSQLVTTREWEGEGYSLGRPDQRDLSENLAATQGLAHMVTESLRLLQLPEFWPDQSVCSPSEEALWADGGRSSPSQGGEEEQDERARLDQTTQHLLREAREKSQGWELCSGPDQVDLAIKKVDDGWPLRLWKGSIEVDAPQKEALQRVLREQDLWEKTLKQSAVVQTLTKDTEIYRYLLQGLGPRPPQEHLLLRTWQSDPSAGPVYVSAISTEHPEAPMEGVRAQVLSCLYLVEPLGTKRSRLTHLCRTDTR